MIKFSPKLCLGTMAHVQRHRRPRKSSGKTKGGLASSFVTVKLYGKIADKWMVGRGKRSDSEFVECLLNLRTRYNAFKAKCKCIDDSSGEESGEDMAVFADESHTDTELDFGHAHHRNSNQKHIVNIEVVQSSNEERDFEDSDEYIQKGASNLAAYRRRCQICGDVLAKGVNKKYHTLTEHFTLYVECKLCEKEQSETVETCKSDLVNMTDYTGHMKSKHNAEEISCPYCKAKCLENNTESIRKHVISKHSGNLVCKCKMCHDGDGNGNNRLIRGASLKGHVRSKHIPDKSKRVPCELCGALIIQCNMTRHIKNLHEEKTAHENNLCDLCGKHFVHLKAHKLSVHRKDSWMHKCETCGRSFAKRYNLEVHSRLHTGERPFICEVCGKGFCQKIELNSHRKNNHEKDKPRQGVKRNAKNNQLASTKAHPDPEAEKPSVSGNQTVVNTTDNILQNFSMETASVNQQPPVMHSLPQVSTEDPLYSTLVGYPVAEERVILTELHMQGANLPVLQNLTSPYDEKLRQDTTTMNLDTINWVQNQPGIPH